MRITTFRVVRPRIVAAAILVLASVGAVGVARAATEPGGPAGTETEKSLIQSNRSPELTGDASWDIEKPGRVDYGGGPACPTGSGAWSAVCDKAKSLGLTSRATVHVPVSTDYKCRASAEVVLAVTSPGVRPARAMVLTHRLTLEKLTPQKCGESSANVNLYGRDDTGERSTLSPDSLGQTGVTTWASWTGVVESSKADGMMIDIRTIFDMSVANDPVASQSFYLY